MKKIYFIGGTSDFSSLIVEDLKIKGDYSITPVGRRTGHSLPESIDKIVNEAISHDVIVLYTYASGHQLELLFNLYKKIEETGWSGHLISFGSTIVLHHKSSMDKVNERHTSVKYQSQKKALQEAGHYFSRCFTSNKFKFTQIQCGMLATDKMKRLPNYRDTCLKPQDLSKMIDFILTSPSNWHLHEIFIDGK
jgi:hypothetical protein